MSFPDRSNGAEQDTRWVKDYGNGFEGFLRDGGHCSWEQDPCSHCD
jgi:hypothetical protein